MTTTAEHLRNTLDGRWRDVKNRMREQLADEVFRPHYTPNTVIARTKVAEQLKIMAAAGAAEDGFKKEHGGNGDVGAAVTQIEMLAMSDLSLMVKAGVQWGLFGGAIENLGTERHHEAYVQRIIDLDLLGFRDDRDGSRQRRAVHRDHRDLRCGDPGIRHRLPDPYLAQGLYRRRSRNRPGRSGFRTADRRGRQAGQPRCALLRGADPRRRGQRPARRDHFDCHYKGGLPGVDNGRIQFDHVRVPRENLLNKYADVAEDGTYTSPIENPNRRFFTMLGTLIRGRVTVGGSAAAARVALDIATRYAWDAGSSLLPTTRAKC